MGVMSARGTRGDKRWSWGPRSTRFSHSSSFLYCSPLAMIMSVEGSVGEADKTDGGSEGKLGSLYSANLDPG